jgi:hypothetical protein
MVAILFIGRVMAKQTFFLFPFVDYEGRYALFSTLLLGVSEFSSRAEVMIYEML